ncbi:MAG: aldehyde dehydrogenase family protein [Desulfocapsaceae bacterium]|nr:aldehyde dehydrogenase family protein [Desulfocapsaceae bacterium]
MTTHYTLMVPGTKSTNTKVKVTSPFDERLLATFEAADKNTIDQALSTAYKLHQNRRNRLTLTERIEILTKTAALMTERAENLALAAAEEGGKPLIDSRTEVARAIDGVHLCIETMRTRGGEVIPMGINQASAHKAAFTNLEPRGVVVAVSAFNHPLNLIVHQVGPAVAAGCPVIVKPAKKTPISCYTFVSLLREAGLPEEWCQAMVIDDAELATKLATDERVGFLSFIGSEKVGWMLRSKIAPGTRCALEHGGVAPVIVAEDADLDAALPKLIKAGFYHAGQVCVSVQRIYVHESIVDDFAEKIANEARKLIIGDPTKKNTDVGPLIDPKEASRVYDWVKEAVEDGAKLLCGGKPLSESCFECTVLLNPPEDAKVSTSEVFGPVVCVYSYTDLDDAVQRANSLPYSFQAAVFTSNIDTAMQVYNEIDASAVMVNEHTAYRVDWMPFAGLRRSGHGTGGIPHTIRDMQVEKMLVIHSPGLPG